jgi:glycosyltransferase involved in cell wall biosynthesis
MSKKRILITIDWFLPGTLSGGPVRSYANLIEHLKDDFDFFIITRNTDYGSYEPYKNITPNIWTDFNASTKIYYISADQLNRTHLKKIVDSVNFDIAYINGIYSWYFSILPIVLLKKIKKPIIISARGMLNSQAFSVKQRKKKIFLALAKLVKLYKGVIFHATNTDEAESIRTEIDLAAQVSVAANLPRKQTQLKQTKRAKGQPVKFVNIARISIEKGTLKMLEALKHIKEPLSLDLYGPIYDQPYWDKCETVIAQLPGHIHVTYKGVLASEDVPLTLQNYDFFVLLSEGENFGHAILEALSAGLPVLISDKTPWKNLESKFIGWDLAINNTELIAKTFAKAIEMPNAEYAKWSSAAFAYAKVFTDNPELIKQNKALFLSALNGETRSGRL